MLKGCCEFIIGSSALNNRADADEAYGARLKNGETQGSIPTEALPQWPSPVYDNEIMFLLPRILRIGDRIYVTGALKNNPQSLIVNLVTGGHSIDYQNIACQLAVDFTADNIALRIIYNGSVETINADNAATSWFTEDDEEFKFGFAFNVSSSAESVTFLDLEIGSSFFEQITLKHSLEQIRYLTLSGDVQKIDNLEFKFA